MVLNVPCEDCNFKTGQSTCWYFGELNLSEIFNKATQGCEKHRLWWTMSGSKRV
jgi:hypothetical protein